MQYLLLVVQALLVCAQDYGVSPVIHPSPQSSGIGWEAAYAVADAFVKQLNLSEKAQFVTGTAGPCVGNIAPIPRLGFDGLCLQDGPIGVRTGSLSSVFPAGLTTAASWDRRLMRLRGQDIGAEFKGKGSHVALGPVAGPLGRSAFGGRNWEGFSPDPYLTGIAMQETITGVQSTGVQACAKHFVGNEQETQRNPSTVNGSTVEALSSNIDDRTLHELYAWPFANAVRAGVASVMCAYNRLNNTYSCQNSKLLNGILKTELGFQGYVVSDWGAVHSGVSSIEAGLDMDMPGGIVTFFESPSFFGGNVSIAVGNTSLSETRVDDMIKRIMTPYFHLGQNNYTPIDAGIQVLSAFQRPFQFNFTYGPADVDVRDDHAAHIRELGAAGIVLLKNVNNTLPLRSPKRIGVFGNSAGPLTDGLFPNPLNQNPLGFEYGHLVSGGGSGAGRLSYLITPLEALQARAYRNGSDIQYLLNNAIIAGPTTIGAYNISNPLGVANVLPVPDTCIVFLKTYANEGMDRPTLEADWQSNMTVTNVASVCNNTIVVTNSAGLNVMPWADNPNVTAILAAHLGGQESGNSIVDVLYGDVNPSGHLPYTIPLNESDYNFTAILNSTELLNSSNPDIWQSNFTEGQLIDYRHFDHYNLSVRYEFGYGLSYTTFNLSGLRINKTPQNLPSSPSGTITPGGHADLWDQVYMIQATVANTGAVAGATVPQLYISLPTIPDDETNGMITPVRVLRGFDKIYLQPGQSQVVSFEIKRRDISYWSTNTQQWVIPTGTFGVQVGFSSRDLPLSGSFDAQPWSPPAAPFDLVHRNIALSNYYNRVRK